ncbi:ATP-binding protein [Saccharothrix sp. ST-888]|uniref:ATP-binding protein n=1 Tax=Saccharothrix sp. ST-888 TaxID=1427391 RepID=UPI0005ECCEE4|nr:ATP-binding protein [Saccharothrix sp. ST-888]
MRVCSSSFFLVLDPVSVPISRQRLGRLIKQWGVRTDNDSRLALDTVISELVTNAVRHTTGAMLTVGVHANLDLRRLIIEVYDGSQALPRHQISGPDEETGRGIFLVERLALAHGAEHTARGKKVWAEVALPEQPLTRRQLLVHPRRAARAVARRLSGPRRPPIHPPALAASRAR